MINLQPAGRFLTKGRPSSKPFNNGDPYGCHIYETFPGSRSSFRSSDQTLESENGTLHIRCQSGIHIIDLRQTLRKLQEAYQYVKQASSEGKSMLFVGTKQSIQRIVLDEAIRCDSPYINFRWLGGFLTNFSTVKQSIGRLQSLRKSPVRTEPTRAF